MKAVRTDKLAIIERRENIKKLIAKGVYSNTSIGKVLKISEVMVRRDKKVIRNELLKLIKREPIEEVLMKVSMAGDEVIKEAWVMYYDEDSTQKTKSLSLRIVLDAVEKQVRIFSGLGLIPKMLPEEGAEGSQINNQQINVFQILMNIKEKEKKEVIDVEKNNH